MSETLKIEYIGIADLIPYANNTRTHTDEQVEKVAASIQEFGFTNPILIDEKLGVVAGHCRLAAAKKSGLEQVPVIRLSHLTEQQRRAYVIADNRLAEEAGWDEEMLAKELAFLANENFSAELTGFDESELSAILAATEELTGGYTDEDDVPEAEEEVVSRTGDVWILGDHRVMCGDSTSVEDVAQLCDGSVAQLIHADPPYGMGKQKDGVANDNLYRDKLDEFQMAWWRAFRPHTTANGSAYIWGNSPDLWRLWYRGGLSDFEKMRVRNEIVWDKKTIAGMKSPLMTQYPEASERCLFIQIGNQGIGNVNSDQYWDGWDEIRLYLKSAADSAGLTAAKCKEITGVSMFSHWVTKSQWQLPSKKHYVALQSSFPDDFKKSYSEIRETYDRIKGGFRGHVNGILGGVRSYFDNAHEVMRDVWEFPRVLGDERHGHATPKPVSMMERVMKSSLPEGGICLEPFAGSGSTLMGAEKTKRRCFTMELQGKYVDVVVRRWERFTGKSAILAGGGAIVRRSCPDPRC